MAERQTGLDHKISEFAGLLLNISLQLTSEDLSNIKLILGVDGVLKRKTLDSLLNTADLLRLLHSRKIVQEDNLNLLMEILIQIHRYDCVKLIQEFTEPIQGEGLPNKGPVFETECDSSLENLNKILTKIPEFTENNPCGSNCSDDDKMIQELNSDYSLEYSIEDEQLAALITDEKI